MYKLLFLLVYGYILFVHYSKWRDKLPRKFNFFCFPFSFSFSCFSSADCLLVFLSWKIHAARPAFYNYVIAMFVFNAIALCASGLTGIGSGFGLWYVEKCLINLDIKIFLSSLAILLSENVHFLYRLYNFTVICYHTLYLPLLYVTFLADFFQVRSCMHLLKISK